MAGNGTITAANAVIMIGVTGLFPTPQQLQKFAAEDVFDTEDVETAEIMMGVDRHLAAGIVYNPIKQGFTLMADSPSNLLFEQTYAAEQLAGDKYFFFGSVYLPSVGRNYTMTRGVLSNYKPMPDAKKVLQPRKFTLTWESVLPSSV